MRIDETGWIDSADLMSEEREEWPMYLGAVKPLTATIPVTLTHHPYIQHETWYADELYGSALDAYLAWRAAHKHAHQAAVLAAREVLRGLAAKYNSTVPPSTREEYRADALERVALGTPEAEEYSAAVDDYEKRTEAYKAERAATKARQDAQKAREAANLEQWKVRWIAAHGSEYLQTAHGEGYSIQRAYVTERAAVEHPGYEVDFAQTLEYADKVCPGPDALKKAVADGATVVWATNPPNEGEDDGFGWEPREALVIEGYLGKYTLVNLTV
jgi:hypothetical protein